MTFNYRFSVIPAGAIIDARLTPRALQVLCLLGRHTNDAGWCSRSQVKMAKELGCGRSTIYDALELCYDAGWVERKRNGRGSTGPESSDQPFAAYSYRVILDRDNIPARIRDAEGDVDEASITPAEDAEGAAMAAGGAVQAAGGAAMTAPLEGIPSKGISSEPERESRAREGEGIPVSEFQAKWPTSATDDQTRTAKVWSTLSNEQRRLAIDGIKPFLEQLKLNKRQHVPTGWRYLEEHRWLLLPKQADGTVVSENATFNCWSREWWALLIQRARQGKLPSFMLSYAIDRGCQPYSAPRAEMPTDDVIATFKSYPSDGPEMASWRPWLEQHRVKLPEWQKRIWVHLPSPSPTGPPSPSLATEQDLQELSNSVGK